MKKKFLLISLMVSLLVCILAISVGAAGSTSDKFAETPATLEGASAPANMGATERVVLLGADGLYYTYPSYYILQDASNKQFRFAQNKALNKALGYDESVTSLMNYVVRIEIPTGLTSMVDSFYNSKTVKYVKMSDTITGTNTKTFQGCSNLETLIFSNSLTTINNDLCNGCSSLTAITIPASVTAINGYCFSGCSNLETVTNYAENVKSIGGNAFSGCSKMTAFNFPDALTSIGSSAFYNCKGLTSIDLPAGITSLGQSAFQNCSGFTSLKLPEGISIIQHNTLHGCSGLRELTIPRGCTVYGQYSFNQNGSNLTITYTGTEGDDGYNSISKYLTKAKYVFANHCDVYYNGEHNDTDNNPCWLTSCDKCGAKDQYCGNENTHSLTSVISYADYTKLGTKTESCSNENCTHVNVVVDSEIAPIFIYYGYSSSYNTGKICVGYSVNKEALNAYGADKLSYGVVAYAPDAEETELEPVVISENNVNAIDGAVVAPLSSEYSSFDFIISGFETEAHYSTALVMCMYIYDGESVDYVCAVGGEAVQVEFAQTVVFADHVEE